MSDKQARMIQKAHRAVIPRQVQQLLDYRDRKRREGSGPSFAKRQAAIRRVLLWSLQLGSVQELSQKVLDSRQQTDLEAAHRAFGLAGLYMREGQMSGSVAGDLLLVARQVLDYWDEGMNRRDDFHRQNAELAGIDPLPSGHLGDLPELRGPD